MHPGAQGLVVHKVIRDIGHRRLPWRRSRRGTFVYPVARGTIRQGHICRRFLHQLLYGLRPIDHKLI